MHSNILDQVNINWFKSIKNQCYYNRKNCHLIKYHNKILFKIKLVFVWINLIENDLNMIKIIYY